MFWGRIWGVGEVVESYLTFLLEIGLLCKPTTSNFNKVGAKAYLFCLVALREKHLSFRRINFVIYPNSALLHVPSTRKRKVSGLCFPLTCLGNWVIYSEHNTRVV